MKNKDLDVEKDLLELVPPAICFAKFRWEDCGRPPVPVMYYWRPGSRCEVGLWRGCLPNLNMFQDEYECVATCIYSARAAPPDYHAINAGDQVETTEVDIASTTGNVTELNSTTTVSSGGTGSGEFTGTTVAVAEGNKTTKATNETVTTVAAV
ncbi:unnamed protein product [Leptosia nina]|uniref:BPTI/Kunitz inhibitor domain-containing protein n=1 Tax=Leptosia nina TaxID=320188 RepID=A0AAV1J7W4_9NEOP